MFTAAHCLVVQPVVFVFDMDQMDLDILFRQILRQQKDAGTNRDHRERMSHVIPFDGDLTVGNLDGDRLQLGSARA